MQKNQNLADENVNSFTNYSLSNQDEQDDSQSKEDINQKVDNLENELNDFINQMENDGAFTSEESNVESDNSLIMLT